MNLYRLKSFFTSESSDYAHKKRSIFFVDIFFSFIFLLIFQFSGLSCTIYNKICTYHPNFYIINSVYVVVFLLLFHIIFLPLSYYSQFHLEHRFNLSSQTFQSWLWDEIKSLLLNLLFSVIIVDVVYVFLKHFPNTWWLWATLFYFSFSIFLGKITPTYILPLFYKIKPVEQFELLESLKSLAQKAHVQLLGIYQMDMSRKTKKANAMFTGLGSSKRIILGDTLLNQFSTDEIKVILAHELGHYRYRHLWQLMIGGLAMSLVGFFLIHKTLLAILSFSSISELHHIAGLPSFLLILFVFLLFLTPLQNGYSRKLEKQADVFALEETQNPQSFISAMKKLAEQNLSEMNPPRWVEFFLYDHPSISKRIRLAEQYLNKT